MSSPDAMVSPTQATAAEPLAANTETYLYPPSYLDQFMNAVEHLPIPYWLTYGALFVLESLLLHVVVWVDGWLAPFTSNPLLFIFPLWQWGSFTIITYLDSVSCEALTIFSPLLHVSTEELQRLKYEFTTIPSRAAILSGVFWAAWYILFAVFTVPTFFADLGIGIPAAASLLSAGFISYSTGSIIYYHSLRQLRLVHRTVSMVKQFDLFRLEPVYAFSKVTSRTAVAWVILLTLTLLTFPVQLAIVPSLLLLVAQMVFAISAFALPLWSVHARLVAEKRHLIGEHGQRLKETLRLLHHDIDHRELAELDHLHFAIADLEVERSILLRIPTWPWRSGLLTGFLSLIGLPIVTFIIQLAITRWIGR